MKSPFIERLLIDTATKQSVLVAGVDLDIRDVPPCVIASVDTDTLNPVMATTEILRRAGEIVLEQVADHAVVAKFNEAFYLRYGSSGIAVLEHLVPKARALGLGVIVDAKVSDGGLSAAAYADTFLGNIPVWDPQQKKMRQITGPLRADAVTIETTIADPGVCEYVRTLVTHGTGAFIVLRTSFGGAPSQIENMRVDDGERCFPFWVEMAKIIKTWCEGCTDANGISALGAVVGATRNPEDLDWARRLLPNCFFLVPGYGAQGGGAATAVRAAADGEHPLLLVNSSRGLSKPWGKNEPPKTVQAFSEMVAAAAAAAHEELWTALLVEHDRREKAG